MASVPEAQLADFGSGLTPVTGSSSTCVIVFASMVRTAPPAKAIGSSSCRPRLPGHDAAQSREHQCNRSEQVVLPRALGCDVHEGGEAQEGDEPPCTPSVPPLGPARGSPPHDGDSRNPECNRRRARDTLCCCQMCRRSAPRGVAERSAGRQGGLEDRKGGETEGRGLRCSSQCVVPLLAHRQDRRPGRPKEPKKVAVLARGNYVRASAPA